MPASSTLTEQLATLGVHLADWPEEPKGDGATGDWIQRGLAYAEGVRLWRAQLRNAPESTKEVVDLLLRHQENGELLTPWDRWLSAAIDQEVQKVVTLDRWRQCIVLLRDTPLTNTQVLGGLLALADAQQLGGAAIGALRLMKSESISSEDALEICALLISRSDTTWRLGEASTCPKAWQELTSICLQCARLLMAVFKKHNNEAGNSGCVVREAAAASLENLLSMLGEEDQWSGIPKARAVELLNQSGLEAALAFIEKEAAWPLPSRTRREHARIIASQLCIESGKWEDAKEINKKAVEQLRELNRQRDRQMSELTIIRAETELLSYELSAALGNSSLQKTAPSSLLDETKRWQSLSRSQLGQDLWVLEQLGWKRGGYFVEFGATDGVLLSNSWLLEKYFDWQGICAEPNPKFYERLQQNRSCRLSPACVYRSSGERMRFTLADAYGGLEGLGQDDQHVDKRNAYAAAGHTIEVTTISLMDLLDQQDAPTVIDYLSIDTEGSELTILEGIDWSRYQFRCITVEHNFTEQRQGIQELLEAKGYQRREAQWDDWYWKQT